MKLSLIVLKISSVLLLALFGLYLFFSSSYYIGNMAQSEIEKDLGIVFEHSADILEYDTYGWAEEGGTRLLFQLSEIDCKSISTKLDFEVQYSNKADYHLFFELQGIAPISLFSKNIFGSNNGFLQYALDLNSCILFRLKHFE